MSGPKLVFVISQPRSGSTLLQTLVSNHPEVNSFSESWLLLPFLGLFQTGLHSSQYNSSLAFQAIQEFYEHHGGMDNFKRDLSIFLEGQFKKTADVNTKYILEKTPRYYEILSLIPEFFPQSRMIVLRRNPLAVLNSIIKTWDITSPFELYEYRRDILLAPFLIRDFMRDNPISSHLLELTYEDLLADVEGVIRGVYEWLDLDFDSAYLDPSFNSKLRGSMGDQSGKGSSKIYVKDENNWMAMLEDKKWNKFVRGYIDYLGEELGKEFGINHQMGKKTGAFNSFVKFCDLDIPKYSLAPYRFFQIIKLKLLYRLLR